MTSIVTAFMRCNPPTLGHVLVWSKVVSEAKKLGADHMIYLSASQDSKKNPLTVEQKIFWAKKMFPIGNFKAADGKVRTFMQMATELDKKYDQFYIVAGSDRISEFEDRLNKYNGRDYNYSSIGIINAGGRDPDTEGLTGISGTKIRQYAIDNNVRGVSQGTGLNMNESKELITQIKTGLQIKENVNPFKLFIETNNIKIGDKVLYESKPAEIIDIRTNYLVLIDSQGTIYKEFSDHINIDEFVEIEYPDNTFKGIPLPITSGLLEDVINRYNGGSIDDPYMIIKLIKAVQNNQWNESKVIYVDELNLHESDLRDAFRDKMASDLLDRLAESLGANNNERLIPDKLDIIMSVFQNKFQKLSSDQITEFESILNKIQGLLYD